MIDSEDIKREYPTYMKIYKEQLAEDCFRVRDSTNCKRKNCTYIHNFQPKDKKGELRKTSYVFLAKEPRVPKSCSCDDFECLCEAGFPNFIWDENDTVIHYCIQSSLDIGLNDYYITDIAKSAMKSSCAYEKKKARYDSWVESIKEELDDHMKDDAKIIVFGNDASDWVEKSLGKEPGLKLLPRIIHMKREGFSPCIA